MAIQTFTALQVLTAAQQNALQANDYNQTVSTKTASYVLVAADKGTRIAMNSATATTITVNTSLFAAGDTLQIVNISSGVCTVTAGTATVSTSGSLALVANAGGTLYFTSAGVATFLANGVTATAGALTLVSSTTIGNAVTSVALTNIFSATYENYRIIISGGAASASEDGTFIFGATATGYYSGIVYNTYNNATPNGAVSSNTANSGYAFAQDVNGLSLDMTILQPQLAKRTSWTFKTSHQSTTTAQYSGGGWVDNATQYTDMTFKAGGATTLTGGTIKVYGYQNS